MKNNSFLDKLYPIYITGFLVILTLPILTIQPWLFPPDWTKAVILRSIVFFLAIVFCFEWLYGKKLTNSQPSLKKNVLLWFLAAFLLVFSVATVFSVDPKFSLWSSPSRGGGFVNLVAYAAVGVLTFLTVKKQDWQKLWKFEIGIGVLVALIAIFQLYGIFDHIILPVANNPPSTMGNSTFLAIYLLFLFFRTLLFFIKEPFEKPALNEATAKKGIYALILAIFLWTIMITSSRAAYLGLLVGLIYLAMAYPKKMMKVKMAAAAMLILVAGAVFLANTQLVPPKFVQENKILRAVYPRLSLKLFLNDSRFYGWKIAFQAFKDKPIIGWGPENFAVGFDKHYDPTLPYINDVVSDWWDRAHNIILDIGVQVGILGLAAYFALFGALFWQLQKLKSKENSSEGLKTDAHLLQTGLVAYLTANLFSFDSFGPYLMYFLVIGYSMSLIFYENVAEAKPLPEAIPPKFLRIWKKPLIAILGILFMIFLWQYNIKPFLINVKINWAEIHVLNQECDKGLEIMEEVMKQHSILDARARIKYVEFMNICANQFPENNLAYAKRGSEIMKEALKIQPLFSRLWIFLGGFTNVQASLEQDAAKKTALLQEADGYLKKAGELAPDHQELIFEHIKNDMIAENYTAMQKEAEKCVAIYPSVGNCYFMRAISKMYLHNFADAKKDLQEASTKGFDIESTAALNQLTTTYAATAQYKELVTTYQMLISRRPKIADYHASLAFVYRELGQYKNARQEALVFLQMMPEAKDEVNAFLKTLPYQ